MAWFGRIIDGVKLADLADDMGGTPHHVNIPSFGRETGAPRRRERPQKIRIATSLSQRNQQLVDRARTKLQELGRQELFNFAGCSKESVIDRIAALSIMGLKPAEVYIQGSALVGAKFTMMVKGQRKRLVVGKGPES